MKFWVRASVCRSPSPIPTAARWPPVVAARAWWGYNVQVAVETENHLIVTHEVTIAGSDSSHLARVGKAAKAVMVTDTVEAVADRGETLVRRPQCNVGYWHEPTVAASHKFVRFWWKN